MKCVDCGGDCKRRTRCKVCGKLVCRWCYHYVHSGKLLDSIVGAIGDPLAAVAAAPQNLDTTANQLLHRG
jgi:hypothetical protein